MIWNNDPNLIRLLHSYGANLSQRIQNGLYPEEQLQYIPYFNHLEYISQNNEDISVVDIRIIEDFVSSINEIKYISGEMNTPNNWVVPFIKY